MMPLSTNKICELLKCFYDKVSQFSPKYSERQQKLKSILLKFQQLNLFDEKPILQIHKISRSTDQSIEFIQQRQNNSKSNKKILNQLFFTFNIKNEQQMKCKQERLSFKYSNPSLSKIIIFSIFFNHYYVANVVEKTRNQVADIVNHNRSIVSLLKNTLQRLKENKHFQRDRKKSQVSNLLGKYLNHNEDCDIQFFTKDLKYFTNNLDEQMADSFVQNLFQRKTSSNLANNLCSRSQDSQGYQQLLLSSLSEHLKIKIVLQYRKFKFQWGSNRSNLSLVIKKSLTKNQYSLKEMSYYSKSDLVKSDNLANNIKKSNNI